MQQQIKTSHYLKKQTPKRIGSSLKKETIHPADYNQYNLPFACEDCSHYIIENKSCSLGLPSEVHQRENQKKSYEISGKVALCRSQEID